MPKIKSYLFAVGVFLGGASAFLVNLEEIINVSKRVYETYFRDEVLYQANEIYAKVKLGANANPLIEKINSLPFYMTSIPDGKAYYVESEVFYLAFEVDHDFKLTFFEVISLNEKFRPQIPFSQKKIGEIVFSADVGQQDHESISGETRYGTVDYRQKTSGWRGTGYLPFDLIYTSVGANFSQAQRVSFDDAFNPAAKKLRTNFKPNGFAIGKQKFESYSYSVTADVDKLML